MLLDVESAQVTDSVWTQDEDLCRSSQRRPGETLCIRAVTAKSILPGASEVEEQVFKNVIICFEILTTSAFVFKIGAYKVKNNTTERVGITRAQRKKKKGSENILE